MSIRAGIVVTGTEVLTGRVPDGNGPWVAEQLRRLGVDIAETTIVGDRPDDLAAAVRRQCSLHDLVITTGGLGPTADDLTAEVVARAQGTELVFDEALHGRIAAIVARLTAARGWTSPDGDLDAGIRKQAMVPRGAVVIEPTGTAPGLVVPPADGLGAPVLVLPGPPRELQAMWPAAVAAGAVAGVVGRAIELRQTTVRLWGPPEAELASALRDHESGPAGGGYDALEVTTCLRQGELEVVSRYAPSAQPAQDALVEALRTRFGAQVFSTDGAQVEELLASALTERGESVATAESCTAGMLAARLTDLAGSSAYVRGGFVTYHDDVKRSQLGVAAELLESVGAVSEEVAVAMAQGARERLAATYGVGITGIAGPGGATDTKPVGLVHVCVAGPQSLVHRRLQLSGSRAHVRERTVQWALHLLREAVEAS